MGVKRNILVVSQAKVGPTETFIQAHIDRLDGNIFHLYGYYLNYYKNGISLRDKYAKKEKWHHKLIHLLPYFLVFKIKQKAKKKHTDFELTKRYLIENKIEVVLAEYGTTGAFITPVCKALQIPLVVHFHGYDASRHDIVNQFEERYNAMFDYSYVIIVVSNAMKRILMQLGCPEEKVILNTYGPHPDFFKIKPDYNSNSIIAIGRMTYKKAPYLTILAFEKVLRNNPELKLIMIGGGELLEVCESIVKGLGLEKKIILVGQKDRQKILKYIEQSFLFVQHSIKASSGDSEGTPVGIIEAMAAGLPIVSTRHAGIPDVVVENETGFLVNENDVENMAVEILRFTGDRDLTKQMGERAKKRIQDHFLMDQHLELLNKVLKGSIE